MGYFAQKLIINKDLPDDDYPDFIGDSVILPGPDKGSWCHNESCKVEAAFGPKYPCSCSNGWPENNKTCQHKYPLDIYVPKVEASRHCLNCDTNVSGCLVVAQGKERRETIWQCQSCPRGKFGYQTKATSLWNGCQDCKKGTYSELESVAKASICKGCPKGTWSSVLGVIAESACKLCVTGKYGQTSVGADSSGSCTDCPTGKFLGTVGYFGIESCEDCPIGYSQKNEGRAFCLPCTPGSFMNENGQDVCFKCSKGQSSTEVAREKSCDVCATGLHQPNLGMTACLGAFIHLLLLFFFTRRRHVFFSSLSSFIFIFDISILKIYVCVNCDSMHSRQIRR